LSTELDNAGLQASFERLAEIQGAGFAHWFRVAGRVLSDARAGPESRAKRPQLRSSRRSERSRCAAAALGGGAPRDPDRTLCRPSGLG